MSKQVNKSIPILAKDIPFGGQFTDKRYNENFMRVKPVGYILHSDLVNTAINENQVFAVRLSTGNLRIIAGSREVRYQPSLKLFIE